ncbi:MAG: hypothetical protein V7711_13095 [Pseudomonadales bacterium]
MLTKKLANGLLGLGILLTVLCIAWWGVVYHFISEKSGETLMSTLTCLFSIGENCTFMRGMSWLQGVNPYEPVFFWLATSILLIALAMKKALRNDGL